MSPVTGAGGAVSALRRAGVPPLLAVTVLLSLILGCMVAKWPTPTLMLFGFAALSIGVVWSREFALGAILVSALVMLSASAWFGLPTQAMLITTALIGLFALTVLLDVGPGNPLRVPLSLIMLTVVLFISIAVGIGSRVVGLYALVVFLSAPIAYLAITLADLSVRSLRRIGLIVIAIMVAQVPIVVAQALFIASHVDEMGGTFGLVGGTHVQAVVMGFAWTAAVGLLFGRRRIWLLPVGVLISVVLLVSEAKAGFLFAAIGTLVIGAVRASADPKRGASSIVVYGLIGVGFFSILFGGYMFVGSLLPGGQEMATFWTSWLTNPAIITDYLFSYNNLGNADRLEGVRLILSQPATAADLLIGRGIGLLTQSTLLGQAAISTSATMAGALDRATSATKALYETGLMGIALYLFAVGASAVAVARAWIFPCDELSIGVTGAAAGCAVVYVLSALYMTSWNMDAVAVLFWCLMGIAVKWGRLRSAERSAAEESELAEPAG